MREVSAVTVTSRHHDVVIIGGGVAGAAAARLLAQWGHDVLVLERERTMRPPLAESLPPSCTPLLEMLGVRDVMDAAGFVRGTGNTVWWGGTPDQPTPVRIEPYASGERGYQVERGTLEALLTQAALASGVTRLAPASARRVEPVTPDDHDTASGAPPRQRILLDHDGSTAVPHEVRAAWVLDCTGRAGLLGRTTRVSSAARTLALVATWDRASGWPLPDGTHTLVESAPWGWGWSVPLSETRRCFTAMVDPARTSVGSDGQLLARYDALFASLPHLGALLTDATREREPWACDATPYHATEVAWPGCLLVGDAASMLDPLSSFGVKKALASAWLAAVVVHTALVTPEHTTAALSLFREREQAYVTSANHMLRSVALDAAAPAGSASAAPSAAPFWTARADREAPALPHLDGAGPDALVARLREDEAVQRAFARLRAAPSVVLPPLSAFTRVARPVVRGNIVRSEPHLALDPHAVPVRYLRGVDLLALLELAAAQGAAGVDAGWLYEQYLRQHGTVALPDFLGALSVLLARGDTRRA